MRLKPKSTVKNPRALLYKRFTSLEQSESLFSVYKTTSDNKYWTFDNLKLEFSEVTPEELGVNTVAVPINDFYTVLNYQGNYFRYTGLAWEKIEHIGETVTLLNAKFNNIGKYQTNAYYYVGSFDYMVKGTIEGTTTQFIKGNIMPLTSLNIKFFDDNIQLLPDDLVVIQGHLYSVENPETVQKQMPKPFKVHFATLNSIL